MKRCFLLFALAVFGFSAFAADIFNILDKPWDEGTELLIKWDLSSVIDSIHISRADSAGVLGIVHVSRDAKGEFTEGKLQPDTTYVYSLIAFLRSPKTSDHVYLSKTDGSALIVTSRQFTNLPDTLKTTLTIDSSPKYVSILKAEGFPTRDWFNRKKLPLLFLLLVLSTGILVFIVLAHRGTDLFIRRINGLDAMDEAIGRATEKGKPILFVPGIGELDDIQTIASLSILSHLAYKAAEYNTNLIVPCKTSMVLSAAREVVKESYLRAGRPDAFRNEQVFYLTDDQFGYVAGIDGIMIREEPAANFFLGTFYAESLILAETGFGTGAIQTAGTAQAHQLPFFVVSCDYTLIGEELYAASAYLSRDPQQLGSLKGCDFGKIVLISMIVIGVIFEISGSTWFTSMLNMVE